MFPKVRPSACYDHEELPYSYFQPTPSVSAPSPSCVYFDIILFHFISLVLLLQFPTERSVFRSFLLLFFLPVCNHRQRIFSVMTCFDSWLIMRASTLLALTSWCSANRGTSQNACPLFASYTCFGFSGEYQGGTEFTRPRSCRTAEKSIFIAALCRITYLFCARAVQPARTWATLSGASLHSLHITSPVISVCVFWQAYSLVGNNGS